MNYLNYIKKNLTRLPYFIGAPISMVPYSLRPGVASIYRQRGMELLEIEGMEAAAKKDFVFSRVKNIASYAYKLIPFYRDIYTAAGVNPEEMESFSDIIELPVVKKSDLQQVPIEYRSASRKGRSIVNTGGSSGQPLEFYIEPSSIGHEWAHVHRVWAKLGFRQSDLKITIAGRANVRNIVEYDSARHQLTVDIYCGWEAVADKLLDIYDYYGPSYLHGYPSATFDFILWLDQNKHPLLPILRKNIKGVFLVSELPSPELRKQVDFLLDCESVSFYGHTERSVLAYEVREYGIYHPFLSYGFAEALDENEGSRLICSSYYNFSSPLIRYDTGDLIKPTIDNGILESFSIQNGRSGEFIIDKAGNKIYLTALIFGRHHKIFDYAMHIQVYQGRPGAAEILIVPRNEISQEVASSLFDSTNVLVDFEFRIVKEPKRTLAGKVPLLVK